MKIKVEAGKEYSMNVDLRVSFFDENDMCIESFDKYRERTKRWVTVKAPKNCSWMTVKQIEKRKG